jgi:methanogenic corrinoid protein MtbC1
MSQGRQSSINTPYMRRAEQAASAESLCSIVYRSRSVAPLSGYELYELVKSAQSRNFRCAITGLLLYDDGQFYQWLEGPTENVSEVMHLIRTDNRHTDLEILSDRPINKRQFGDWSMRLATRGARSIHSGHNVVVPSSEMFEELAREPSRAPAILGQFSASLIGIAPSGSMSPSKMSNQALNSQSTAMIEDVLFGAVIPELIARHALTGQKQLWASDARARALADLLIGADHGAAFEFIRALQNEGTSVRRLYETLVEPAARSLGDLWSCDECSEFDVTLGLSQLQSVVRRLTEDLPPIGPGGAFLPAVLVVPEPGEIHSLTAALDSDALWQAGWSPQNEFPASDEALQDLMADSWFDALDLSLSTALRREHWLPRVAKTIALARRASRNPALIVVVGGRVFAEDIGASARVGADGSMRTALDTEHRIRDELKKRQAD